MNMLGLGISITGAYSAGILSACVPICLQAIGYNEHDAKRRLVDI
ncbi:MAG: hypothetical protein VB130_03730 [Clostridium sp.]|nr:hypothetical protein [Clostridium sp.]